MLKLIILLQLKLTGVQVELELKGKEEETTTVRGKKKARTQPVTPLDYDRLALLLEVLQSKKKFKEDGDLTGSEDDEAEQIGELGVRTNKEIEKPV